MVIGFAMMFVLYLLKVNGIGLRKVGYEELSIAMSIPLFLVGAIAAASMVIPGISGSMVVLILGYYELMTVSISKLNMIFIIPFAIKNSNIENTRAKIQIKYILISLHKLYAIFTIFFIDYSPNLKMLSSTKIMSVVWLIIIIVFSFLISSKYFINKS